VDAQRYHPQGDQAASGRLHDREVAICRQYHIDPLGLIGSGALLVTAPVNRVARLLRAWARRGIEGRIIGSVERGRGVRASREGRQVPFPWLARDEIITRWDSG
jgi:hydrogenase maturation factor